MDENLTSMHGTTTHAKPEGSVGNVLEPTTQQLILTNAELGSQNIHNLLLRGKPFEDLGLGTSPATTMANLARLLVLLSQEQEVETDY